MSLSTARSFLSEAGYGEQELDANSALMELDKGVHPTLMNIMLANYLSISASSSRLLWQASVFIDFRFDIGVNLSCKIMQSYVEHSLVLVFIEM